MALIAAAAKAIRTLSIKVGTADYAKHTARCAILPQSSNVVWKGGTPDAILTDVSAASYTLELDIVHDYQTPTSFYNYLKANEGTSATFIYKPDESSVFQATVTAVIPPIGIGGKVDAFGAETVKMPCSKPTVVQPS